MIKIYKDQYATKKQLVKAIEQVKADMEHWRTSIGVPAPQIPEDLKPIIHGAEYEFVSMTEEEAENKKLKEEQEKAEAEKAKAQKNPSPQYAEYRSSEYPSLPEQLDYIYHHGLAAWKKDMIKPIKDKYPKLS